MAKNHPLTLPLLILVCLALFWVLGIQRTTNAEDTLEAPGISSGVSARSDFEDGTPAPPAVSPRPVRSRMKGRIRLKPGQTGAMTYVDMEPGMTGILLVKPEAQPDGTILVDSQMLKLPDNTARAAVLDQVLPGSLDYERYTALEPELEIALRQALLLAEGVKQDPRPRNLVRPGQPARHKSMVTDTHGRKLRGEILNIIVHPLDADEGFEVQLDLDTYTLPEE